MPQGSQTPVASIEVRWFLDGDASSHPGVRHWFENYAPIPRSSNVGAITWRGRLGEQPDVYLLLPGHADVGIKWREGMLQVKGLVEDLGRHAFCGRYEGSIQRWIKWTYADLPAAYRSLLDARDDPGIEIASVGKRRAMRLMRCDMSDSPLEVPTGQWFDRGLGFEMTELELAGRNYCSIGFEAFPSDEWQRPEFVAIVERFLEGLAESVLLNARSFSYPAWLVSVSG